MAGRREDWLRLHHVDLSPALSSASIRATLPGAVVRVAVLRVKKGARLRSERKQAKSLTHCGSGKATVNGRSSPARTFAPDNSFFHPPPPPLLHQLTRCLCTLATCVKSVLSQSSKRYHSLTRSLHHCIEDGKTLTWPTLAMLSASIAAASTAIRTRSTSVTEITSAAYKRAQALNPMVNSFISFCDPLRRAQQLDEQLDQQSSHEQETSRCGPLYGIPVAIKDNFHVEGYKTTCASKVLAQFTSNIDSTVAHKLKSAGAVIIGKTNMDEFAIGSGNVDSYFGPCINPLSPALEPFLGYNINCDAINTPPFDRKVLEESHDFLIPGGSSGGSAVAVSSGCVFAAIGSDTGGSTRQPAALNGIVGFKPTYGLVSRYGLVPLSHTLDTVGIMARNVPDVRTVFSVLRGFDGKDATSQRRQLTRRRYGDSAIVIGIPVQFESFNMDPVVNRLWHSVASQIASNMKGCVTVQKVSIPHLVFCQACYCVLNSCEIASNFSCYDGIEYGYSLRVAASSSSSPPSPSPSSSSSSSSSWLESLLETRADSFGDSVMGRILAGNYFLLDENVPQYLEPAYRLRRLIFEDTLSVLNSVDFILAPSTPGPASCMKNWLKLQVKTQREAASQEDSFLHLANLTGIPSIVIPVGQSNCATKSGSPSLPLSLQLCSAPFRDLDLLDIAEKISLMVDSLK